MATSLADIQEGNIGLESIVKSGEEGREKGEYQPFTFSNLFAHKKNQERSAVHTEQLQESQPINPIANDYLQKYFSQPSKIKKSSINRSKQPPLPSNYEDVKRGVEKVQRLVQYVMSKAFSKIREQKKILRNELVFSGRSKPSRLQQLKVINQNLLASGKIPRMSSAKSHQSFLQTHANMQSIQKLFESHAKKIGKTNQPDTTKRQSENRAPSYSQLYDSISNALYPSRSQINNSPIHKIIGRPSQKQIPFKKVQTTRMQPQYYNYRGLYSFKNPPNRLPGSRITNQVYLTRQQNQRLAKARKPRPSKNKPAAQIAPAKQLNSGQQYQYQLVKKQRADSQLTSNPYVMQHSVHSSVSSRKRSISSQRSLCNPYQLNQPPLIQPISNPYVNKVIYVRQPAQLPNTDVYFPMQAATPIIRKSHRRSSSDPKQLQLGEYITRTQYLNQQQALKAHY